MKRKIVSLLLALVMVVTASACGKSAEQNKTDNTAKQETKVEAEKPKEETKEPAKEAEKEVLEFYHGYFHAESEWPVAKVMRDFYDEFAKMHADGPVEFKPIAVENRDDIVSAKVAGGSFPDMVDTGGAGVPLAAISQNLALDLKPFIDENNLQEAVGINYTQHNVDGHIYSVHDQIESRGLWFNSEIFKKINVEPKEALKDWESFGAAMQKIRDLNDGSYGYIAGQGSTYILNTHMALSETGRKMAESPLTAETINSAEFKEAFLTAAKLDQANGSEHTTEDTGNLMAEFNTNGKVGVLFNGVWNAGGIAENLVSVIEPEIFLNKVSVASAGGGLAIAGGMSEEKTKLALEFLRYMTSKEVQEKIFTMAQANPCNTTVDIEALAKTADNPATQKLAKACAMVNNAEIKVIDLGYAWGFDVKSAIINALMECAVSGADIDARFEQLQKELMAIVG